MSKLIILIFSGLAIFLILAAIFYRIATPLLEISVFKNSHEMHLFVWIIFILGIPAGLTIKFLLLFFGSR